MVISTKAIIRIGALCGALTAISAISLSAWGFIRPYAQSDPPPLAGLKTVQAEDQKITELAQNFKQMQQHQDYADQSALFLAQGFWTQQMAEAQQELRQRPYDLAARQQLLNAEAQLSVIQKLLASRHP